MARKSIHEKVLNVEDRLPHKLEKVKGERTQVEFARDLQVSQQAVSKALSDGSIGRRFIVRLRVAEGVDLNWLLGDKI